MRRALATSLADRIAIVRRGQIIAQGTPAELKHRLLGDPIMEIRLASPLNGLVNFLNERVDVVAHGMDWVRFTVPDPARCNPVLLAELARRETPVVTLSEVSRSLEEIYLRIVNSDKEIESFGTLDESREERGA